MTKKVLFVATTAKGHINVFHIPYINMFHEIGWEVHVISNGDENVPNTHKQFTVPIERSPLRFNNIMALLQMIAIMKKEKYDLVTCHTPMGGVLTRIAAHVTRTQPVIYTAHGFHFYKGAPFIHSFIYKNMEKFLAHWTDALVTINEEDYESAKCFRLNKNGKLYHILGIGVDTNRIKNTHIDTSKKRKELGIPKDAIVVLNVGEFIKRKNQETAIKAISQCKNEKIILVICGRGEMETELKQLVETLGIKNRVIFAGFRKDVNEILQIADIFLFPTFQEGLPVAVMEAMAAKLPVVCSDVRGNRDLIENEKGGFLIQPLDVNTISDILDELANDNLLRKEMGNYNFLISHNYDTIHIVNTMKNIYIEVLGYSI